MSEIQDRVTRIIVQQLKVEPERVVPRATFIQDLGADSLALVELILAMEEEFNFSIPDDDAEAIRTVQDAIGFIEANKEQIT